MRYCTQARRQVIAADCAQDREWFTAARDPNRTLYTNQRKIGADVPKDDTSTDPPPGKPGRPRVAEAGSTVSTWVSQADHDHLIQLAQRHDLSVSSLVRQLITRRFRA